MTVSDLNDGYKDTQGEQLCQVSHCKVQRTAANKHHKRGLPSLAFKGNHRAALKNSFPSSAQGVEQETREVSQLLPAVARGFDSMKTQMVH